MADRPSDTLSVGGKTIRMTYGVLNDITRIGIDITELGLLIVDPEVRNAVITIVMTPRNADGDFDTPDGEPLPVARFDLSLDEVQDILEWVVDHVAAFFMRSIEQAARLRERYEARASSLMSSSIGSVPSTGKSPSAGPSTASQPNSAASTGDIPSTT